MHTEISISSSKIHIIDHTVHGVNGIDTIHIVRDGSRLKIVDIRVASRTTCIRHAVGIVFTIERIRYLTE